ncbi:MAG: DUF2442 domain-containing protein [Planctomycetes bacterium]|nr:DUF2442 domain-containing protein [Planctomycetota bacterium]
MNPRVRKAKAIENFKVEIEFSNGEFRVYDCSAILEFGVFKRLKDENYFRQLRVLDGTICWPEGQDICLDTLYLDSVPMTDAWLASR